MSNDSTGKTGPLSLADRHKQGLLGDDMELPLSEVMELEFPGEQMMRGMWTPEYTRWQGLIVAACRFGLLGKDEKTRGVWCIPRDAYRTWRTSQPEPPTGSFISLWLGATPAVETLPPALPTLPAEPSRPEQTATTARPAEPSIPEPIAKGGAAEKSRKTIALVTAENAALVALRKELEREPTAYQWVKYWRDGKDTEGTIKEITKTHVIWIGKDNQTHRTALTTMNTRFTEAKKRNPFKPS